MKSGLRYSVGAVAVRASRGAWVRWRGRDGSLAADLSASVRMSCLRCSVKSAPGGDSFEKFFFFFSSEESSFSTCFFFPSEEVL